MNKLEEIAKHKQAEIDLLRSSRPSFREALGKANGKLAIIAEIKKTSPSSGLVTSNSTKDIAACYIEAKVNAISLLTDRKYFGGSIDDILDIKSLNPDIAVLYKDFVISERQIYQAYLFGFSAVLLIVKLLKEAALLERFIKTAELLGLDSLVEVNSKEEIKIALAAGAKIIGVNCRNLDNFTLEPALFYELLPLIPGHLYKLALSGVKTATDLLPLKGLCNGVLIGTGLCALPLKSINTQLNQFKEI